MPDSRFSRQLELVAQNERRKRRKTKVIGRPWWNAVLAIVLLGIVLAAFVSPVAGEAILPKRLRAAIPSVSGVNSYSDVLDNAVNRKRKASTQETSSEPKAEIAGDQQQKPPDASVLSLEAERERNAEPAAEDGSQTPRSKMSTQKAVAPQSGQATTTTTMPLPTAPPKEALVNSSTRFYGLATPDAPFSMASVDQFGEAVGKKPNLLMYFQSWDTPFNAYPVQQAWRAGALPVMSWEPYFVSTAQQPTLADISSGKYDMWIDKFARDVRTANLPLGIRFAHEMNGRWYPWSEQKFGNQRGDYVAAWRRVHDRFERAGATNVIWIWSPNIVGSRPELPLRDVYPGDAYVDWAGLSGYYRWRSAEGPSFAATFAHSIEAIRSVTQKRIMLTEIGAGTSSVNERARWISDVLNSVASRNDLVGFTYFEQDKHDQGSQDWRVLPNAETEEAFRRAVANPKFGAAP